MLLEPMVHNVQILSVLHLSWDKHIATAAPRPFHALSFRRIGNAHFKTPTDSLHLKTGEVLFVPENVGYQLRAEKEELFVIHFKAPIDSSKLESFRLVQTSHMDELFAACYKAWQKKNAGYYFHVMSLFYSILEQLSVTSIGESSTNKQMKIQPVLDFLQTHFTDHDLIVKQLADIVYMSETYFRTVFAQITGELPTKYINRLRMEYAKDLIETGIYKIETVAEMAGFSDAKYFSTVFRHYTGFSPRNYKK